MLAKPPQPSFPWQRSLSSPVARQWVVFTTAGRFGLQLWCDRLLGRHSRKTCQKRARWLTKSLLRLGPTFIKIGQALSTRADLLPREYVEALGELQDRVPSFPADEAIALIEAELGRSIYSIFRDFNPLPLAAASLGQVHKVRLHTGEEAIVKVQRPGLQKLFSQDFQAIGKLLRFCRRYFPWTRKYELEKIYDEFFRILNQEIDYLQEGKNAERFALNFCDEPKIVVPKVYWPYTTSKVLTVEYAPGIKIDDRASIEAAGINPKEITKIGICCYLKQLLIDGFFQADPHPGNLALSPDGKIIFYDFGMMVEVNALNKQEMVRNFFAVLRKDTDEVVDTLTRMGLIEPTNDMTPVRRLMTFLLQEFTEKPVDVRAFGQIRQELYVMFEQQPFRLPAEMTYILKALTTLDGIARALDPQYNLMAAVQPFVKSLTAGKGRTGLLAELARQARDFVAYKLRQPNRTQEFLQKLERRIEDGELQLRVRSLESERAFKRLHLALKALIYGNLSGFSFLGGAVLTTGSVSYPAWGIVAFCFAGFCLLLSLRSLVALSLRERVDRLLEK